MNEVAGVKFSNSQAYVSGGKSGRAIVPLIFDKYVGCEMAAGPARGA